jgi:hypothetical protein
MREIMRIALGVLLMLSVVRLLAQETAKRNIRVRPASSPQPPGETIPWRCFYAYSTCSTWMVTASRR